MVLTKGILVFVWAGGGGVGGTLASVRFVPDSVVLRELCVCPQICQRGFISHSFKTVVVLLLHGCGSDDEWTTSCTSLHVENKSLVSFFADCPCKLLQRVFVMPNMDDLVIPILRASQGESQTDDLDSTSSAFSTSSWKWRWSSVALVVHPAKSWEVIPTFPAVLQCRFQLLMYMVLPFVSWVKSSLWNRTEVIFGINIASLVRIHIHSQRTRLSGVLLVWCHLADG